MNAKGGTQGRIGGGTTCDKLTFSGSPIERGIRGAETVTLEMWFESTNVESLCRVVRCRAFIIAMNELTYTDAKAKFVSSNIRNTTRTHVL
jgi:hypothetical protein